MRDLGKKRYGLHLGALAAFVLGTLAAGGLGGILGGTMTTNLLQQPPFSPPGWVFPLVWTILYTFMGVAAYLVWNTKEVDRRELLRPYYWQLAVNLLWPFFFFRLEWRLFAFFWMLLLLALISLTMAKFRQAGRAPFWLLVPYLAWGLFAAYLNLGFYLLNR